MKKKFINTVIPYPFMVISVTEYKTFFQDFIMLSDNFLVCEALPRDSTDGVSSKNFVCHKAELS
ncbi:MAG: hypothetical protein BWK80_08575 [Desulfobacteraceae bacterium IS3]|nr:MAG: hypothetical protein BWK80_08575 [Desulfobacteraceae bacterium IS3]